MAKDLRGLPRTDVQRILARIEALRDDPGPPGAEKPSGQERYRVRQGVYLILYSVMVAKLLVEVVKVGHRREVYPTDAAFVRHGAACASAWQSHERRLFSHDAARRVSTGYAILGGLRDTLTVKSAVP